MSYLNEMEPKSLGHAYDTIIFTSANKKSIQLIMHTLYEYKLLNEQEKKLPYVHNKTVGCIFQEIKDATGFNKGKFPSLTLNILLCILEKKSIFQS